MLSLFQHFNFMRKAVKKRGFTLIEIMVVISIISVLSSIVFASIATARDKGRIGAALLFDANLYHVYGSDNMARIRFGANSAMTNLGMYQIQYASYGCTGNDCVNFQAEYPGGSGYSFKGIYGDTNFSYLRLPLSNVVNASTYTLSAFVKPDDVGTVTGKRYIMSTTCSGSGSSSGYCSVGNITHALFFQNSTASGFSNICVRDNIGGSNCVAVTVPFSKWSHITVSYSGTTQSGGTNKFYYYLDGKLLNPGGTLSLSNSADGSSNSYGYAGVVCVGHNSYEQYPLNGYIANPSIYTESMVKQ